MHPWPGSPAINSENRLTHFQQAHPHNFFAKHNDSVCHMFAPPFSENIDLQGSVYHGYAVGVKMPTGACLVQAIDHRDQLLLLRQCLDKLTGKLTYLCWAGALDGLLGQWAGHFQVDAAYKILDAGNAGRIHA
jgi:hypothetical protein